MKYTTGIKQEMRQAETWMRAMGTATEALERLFKERRQAEKRMHRAALDESHGHCNRSPREGI